MKLAVPFSYSIDYTIKRKRIVWQTQGFATADLEVEPVHGPAKLAFELGCPLLEGMNERCSTFYAPPGETVRVYRAEDTYWVEICSAEAAPSLIADRGSMKRDPFAVLYRPGPNGVVLSLASRTEAKTREEIEAKHAKEGGLRKWDEDGRAGRSAVELLIRHRAKNDLREIDGRLCMRVSEPVLGFIYHFDQSATDTSREERPGSGNGLRTGTYLIVEQSTDDTPAGFTPIWTLQPSTHKHWRIDQLQAAMAVADACSNEGEEVNRPLLTIGRLDTTDCLFEGSKPLLEQAIDRLRGILAERHIAEMDGAQLSIFLDLQHVYERDAGRLSPEYLGLARRLSETFEREFKTNIAHHVRSAMRNGDGNTFHGFPGEIDRELAPARAFLREAIAVFGARPRDGREWVERALPCGVLAGQGNVDTIEVLTLLDGQRLIDAGCDREVLNALQSAARGETHVICIEDLDGAVRPYAGILVEDGGAWRLDRIIGPPGLKLKGEADCRARFEAFTAHANEAAAENEVLISLAL